MHLRFQLATAGLLLAGFAASHAQAEVPANQLTDAEKKSGWQLLFDGNSTDGWRNYQKDTVSDGWKIQDGALVREGNGAGDIITSQKFKAFELSLQYKISKGGNSGVMFHVTEENKRPWQSGPEIQVQDNVDGHDPQKAGWLYQLYQPAAPRWVQNKETPDSTRPAGQWNELYIRIAPAPQQSEVCMNGVLYYRFKLGDKNWDQRVAKSKFAKFEGFGKAGEGHICLQDHGNLVSYRNIKVRELAADGSVPQPIDGKLGLKGVPAYPKLKWDGWDAIDEDGRVRPLRIMELTYAQGDKKYLYAASQHGAIWRFENKPDVTESKLILDLRGKAKDWKKPGANEQGLLGLAMHPQFSSNGYFFVYYSSPDDKKSVISRFTLAPGSDQVDPSTEKQVLEIDQPFKNHNGGSIEFGADGMLYVGVGDGGDRNDPMAGGQNLGSLLGSILRIDVNADSDGKGYSIPSDNPFVSKEGAKGEIFAYGMRNPWRIAFDKETNDLWVADVGQELWEEVNVVTKGGNYGWSNREGTHAFGNRPRVEGTSEPIDPVWEYDHRIGKSITGGRVYRGSKVASLAGKYLYADYVTGRVWALAYDASTGKATTNEEVLPESIPVLAFGQDADGEVYYLNNSTKGQCIYRFASGS